MAGEAMSQCGVCLREAHAGIACTDVDFYVELGKQQERERMQTVFTRMLEDVDKVFLVEPVGAKWTRLAADIVVLQKIIALLEDGAKETTHG